METTVYCPDIECDSCVRVINRSLGRLAGVQKINFRSDSVAIRFDANKLSADELVDAIKESGFRADLQPFERKTISERIRHFRENRAVYEIEERAAKYFFYSFVILSVLWVVAYYGLLKNIPDFLTKYIWWLLYLNISVSSLAAAGWHFLSYKGKITSMTGMMIGMVFGMQVGMMIGAVVGATNGFFTGAMTGMILGVVAGIFTGNSGGIMGILQGMMAGLMGGTMGPMISLMMLSDHLLWFMPFYMIINVLILFGLIYLYYEEVVEEKKVVKAPADFSSFASVCIIISTILGLIMIYGPKSVLVR